MDMSKELQALIIKIDESHWETEKEKREIRYCIVKIKEREQRLEAIENSKPSEALECVDILKEDGCITTLTQGKALETIRQALLKAQEQEKELTIVEKVKSGKIHIHIGTDFVMMNKDKYYEYVDNEIEPVSKRILQAKCELQEKVLEIIKEKNVDINYLRYNTFHDYNCHILVRDGLDTKNQLTQEEFDLLKEWLDGKETNTD